MEITLWVSICQHKEEWRNLVDTLEIGELKGQPPKVNIIVTEKYLTALALKLKGAANVNGKQGRVKSPPLNLDLEGPAHSVSDTAAVTEAFMNLKAARSHCAVCGPTKPCLDEGDTHHELSVSKLKSWARSLAVHTPMVTLSRPPHTEAFEVLFKKQNQPTPPDPIVIAPPVPPMRAVPAPGTTWPFYPSLPGYPPGYPVYPQHMSPMPYAYSHLPFPAVPAPAPVPAPTAVSEPSSDPPEAGTPSIYPECLVFMNSALWYKKNDSCLEGRDYGGGARLVGDGGGDTSAGVVSSSSGIVLGIALGNRRVTFVAAVRATSTLTSSFMVAMSWQSKKGRVTCMIVRHVLISKEGPSSSPSID
ncbi:hypothetical protein JB92DRAFT_2835254 [Gautieria morchelliformis]|nr:hypothetical protein JB92DRAFT_2835254 [Gautieria morchelliformis]